MTSALSAFLARNSVIAAEGLPLVHSTRSYNIRAILNGDSLKPQPCDVFHGEDLTYFFVGRPAYKHSSDHSSAEAWELPCCFVFEASSVTSIKRVYPFDSGAFASGRYPTYIGAMPLKEFEVSGDECIGKIIGSFFGSPSRYFKLSPKSREDFEQEFSLNPLDAELSAAIRLAAEGTPTGFDDRRFTIEVQSDSEINLGAINPIAVILPEIYLDVEGILETIEGKWNAEAIGYPIYPLSLSSYYAVIYKEIHKLYERRGFL